MYKKIMVPLDGSKLAECVLPHVAAIAQGCGVTAVVFVRAVEPMKTAGAEGMDAIDVGKWEAKGRVAAETYIKNAAAAANYAGVSVEGKVIPGKAAEALADYATKNGVDLIVMATHGRSGISRWTWGSVADKLLRSACAPVLLIRAPGCVPGF